MSTPLKLLRELSAQGIGVRAERGRLVFDAPAGVLTEELRGRLRRASGALLRLLGESGASDEGIVRLRDGPQGAALFCVCGVELYAPLAQALTSPMVVYGAYIPDEEVELFDGYNASYRTIDQMADLYTEAILATLPRGTIHLAGLSFGGAIAFEVARRLRARGGNVGIVALLDTLIPRGRFLKTGEYALACAGQLREHGLGHLRRRLTLRLKSALDRFGLRRTFVPGRVETPAETWDRRGRLYRRALAEHHFTPYHGELLLVRATNHVSFGGWGLHPDYGWSDLALGGMAIRDIEADHAGLLEEPAVLRLAAVMDQCVMRIAGSEGNAATQAAQYGRRKGTPDSWASVVRGFDEPTPLGIDRLIDPAHPREPSSIAIDCAAAMCSAVEALVGARTLDPLTPWVAAWATLLHRYGGAEDVLFDLVDCGPPLPLRVAIRPHAPVERWLSEVDGAVRRWRSLPAIELSGLRTIASVDASTRLCRTAVAFGGVFDDRLYDLVLDVAAPDAPRLTFDAARAPVAAVARIGGHLATILDGLRTASDRTCAELPLLTPAEYRRVVFDWNATEHDFPRDRCLHELFEARAAARPDDPAVIASDGTLSYAELDARANQLAHHLKALGVGPDTVVGVCLHRKRALVVTLLAIAKAGGAYVPLDPGYPVDRLGFMLEDAGVPVLVTENALLDRVAQAKGTTVVVDRDATTIADHPADRVGAHVDPENLAYVIFTSGSTGRPKGVMVNHRGRVSNFADFNRRFDVGPGDRLLAMSSLGFDMTAYDVFGTLMAGAAIVLVPSEETKNPAAWAELVRAHGVTVWHSVPALLDLLVDHVTPRSELHPSTLRLVLLGGDWIPLTLPDRMRALVPGLRFISMGGATEVSMDSTIYEVEVSNPAWNSIPYGVPMANQRAYVLDPHLQPAPVGVLGELYLGGIGVGRGYRNRPELTEAKFLPNPFVSGERIYRTGDLVRWGDDGNLELVGRIDYQVKVRGVRIEIGEIEAALREHPVVREGVVMARDGIGRDKRLVAYVMLPPDVSAPAGLVSRLREHLEERLPVAMIPSAFVVLERFPLTPNGKIDRRALPEPDSARPDLDEALLPPRDALEVWLAARWCELLALPAVGVRDRFLAVGGTSLQATQLAARLADRFQLSPSVDECMTSTIEQLAAQLRSLAADADERVRGVDSAFKTQIPVRPASTSTPASVAQRALWFLDQLDPGSPRYNVPAATRLQGPLDAGAMASALSCVVARHDALRTAFFAGADGPVGRVHPAAPLLLPVVDVSELPAAARVEEAARRVAELAREPFDLTRAPLLRAALLRLADDDHVLTFCAHHIAIDGWSFGVLARELAELYAAAVAGRAPYLPALSVKFADFAAWESERLASPAVERHLAYWAEQLRAPLPLLELPLDAPRTHAGQRGGHVPLKISQENATRLARIAAAEGATGFELAMALVLATLHRVTEQDDIVVGTTTAGRPRTELEGLIGNFVNTLPLRVRGLAGQPFPALLQRVRAAMAEFRAHDEVPFGWLVDRLNPPRIPGRNPFFDVSLTFFDTRRIPLVFGYGFPTPVAEVLDLGGLSGRAFPVESETSKFDLTFLVWNSPRGIEGALEFDAGIIDPARAMAIAQTLADVSAEVASGPKVEMASSSPELGDGVKRKRLTKRPRRAIVRGGEGP